MLEVEYESLVRLPLGEASLACPGGIILFLAHPAIFGEGFEAEYGLQYIFWAGVIDMVGWWCWGFWFALR
jgi:hypothetical protein